MSARERAPYVDEELQVPTLEGCLNFVLGGHLKCDPVTNAEG